MNGSPFFFNLKEREMLSDFIIPVSAQAFPNKEGVAVEAASIPNYLAKNLSEEAKALNLAQAHLTRAGTGLATGGAIISGGFTLFLIHAATENSANAVTANLTVAQGALETAKSQLSQASGPLQKKLFQEFVEIETKKVANAGIKIAINNTTKLGNKAIGPLLSNAVGPIASGGVGLFLSGFMPTGGKAIEIAIFEDNLKKDCYIKERQQNWMTMSDGEKLENFAFLFKMLVIDSADNFSYLIPTGPAGQSEQRRLETKAVDILLQNEFLNMPLRDQILASMDTRYNTPPNMYYYREANLTLEQAINKANFNRWQLAKEDEVREAWISGFDAYAFLRMADGRFAVPVQSDHSNFKRGANIDAKGGNQGFLYTVNRKDYKRIQSRFKKHLYIASQNNSPLEAIKSNEDEQLWKVIPAGNGWVRIQNLENPELYLNFSGHKLEVVKILPNWASALWKFQPGYGEYIRIQNNWYPDKYIHNENGKLEVGPITDNMWSAMWKFE
ncbi:hypothetical protein JCM19274_204 [Algibacter lectus]|uniref:Uncharacterized protein n=1 Tax=Algibacter lectus TaxID=221126 RepID=A0A090X001_9FLAO|nr:hypothetical protein [Algibacter lectus]GAL82526.1 hypothetical protein JCM19274_204 [Algibacter lectus]